MRKKAFIINYYDHEDSGVSFKGRALSEINVGDKLLYILDERIKNEYSVTKIIAYCKELKSIHEGMTCELIAKGDALEFKEDGLLYLQ